MPGGWNKGLIQTDWTRQVKEKYGEQFELISMSGTNDKGERTLVIRCSTCGTEKTISSISTRGSKKCRCLVCFPPKPRQRTEERLRTLKAKEVQKQIETSKKKLKKEKKRIKKRVEEDQIVFGFCECGAILPPRKRTCDECKRKTLRAIESRKETKRRMKTKGAFDKTITLEKLFERDSGICYLCQKTCNWKDYQIVNGAFVIGESYPTIEHVLAICNGGTHTWGNVKLACHACNSKKGRKLLAG